MLGALALLLLRYATEPMGQPALQPATDLYLPIEPQHLGAASGDVAALVVALDVSWLVEPAGLRILLDVEVVLEQPQQLAEYLPVSGLAPAASPMEQLETTLLSLGGDAQLFAVPLEIG